MILNELEKLQDEHDRRRNIDIDNVTLQIRSGYSAMVRSAMHDRMRYVGKDRRLNVRKPSLIRRLILWVFGR